MPRGFKRDAEATRLRQPQVVDGVLKLDMRLGAETRSFLDKRSFVSLPKNGMAHEILYGRDVMLRRMEVYKRDRGMCQLRLSKHCTRRLEYETFDLEHERGGLCERCWCLHNLRASCRPCHIIKDGRQPRWSRHEA